jgi:hypothetical protein
MTNKTTIHIEWDKGGKISYNVSGVTLPPPRDDKKLWVLAPSALFLLAHQFGSMKPSHGLITCGTIIDMLFDNKYVLVPINSALKGAMIDFVYAGESSIKVQFHPKHGMFANSDSVEEGVRQLTNNYIHYAYTQIDELTQLMVTRLASIAITVYLDFIEEQLRANLIEKDKDVWSLSFSLMSSKLVAWLSQKYYVPSHGTSSENEQWIKVELGFLEEQRTILESKRRSLFLAMGLN